MSNRLNLVAGFALTLLLALTPSTGSAQERVTLEWQNAPLTDVIRAFASFSGRTIVVETDVRDAQVTASFQDVDWQVALDLILARVGLVKRVDPSGVIRVERAALANPRGAGTAP